MAVLSRQMVRIVLIVLSTTACSFAVTRGAGDYRAVPGGPPPSCTASVGPPIVDGLFAAAFIALKVKVTREACANPEDPNGCSIGSGVSTVVYGLPALAFGIGAVVGAIKVRGCRDAQSAYADVQHAPR